jgi:hypothetical protein
MAGAAPEEQSTISLLVCHTSEKIVCWRMVLVSRWRRSRWLLSRTELEPTRRQATSTACTAAAIALAGQAEKGHLGRRRPPARPALFIRAVDEVEQERTDRPEPNLGAPQFSLAELIIDEGGLGPGRGDRWLARMWSSTKASAARPTPRGTALRQGRSTARADCW